MRRERRCTLRPPGRHNSVNMASHAYAHAHARAHACTPHAYTLHMHCTCTACIHHARAWHSLKSNMATVIVPTSTQKEQHCCAYALMPPSPSVSSRSLALAGTSSATASSTRASSALYKPARSDVGVGGGLGLAAAAAGGADAAGRGSTAGLILALSGDASCSRRALSSLSVRASVLFAGTPALKRALSPARFSRSIAPGEVTFFAWWELWAVAAGGSCTWWLMPSWLKASPRSSSVSCSIARRKSGMLLWDVHRPTISVRWLYTLGEAATAT
jgi:hypothetical protein